MLTRFAIGCYTAARRAKFDSHKHVFSLLYVLHTSHDLHTANSLLNGTDVQSVANVCGTATRVLPNTLSHLHMDVASKYHSFTLQGSVGYLQRRELAPFTQPHFSILLCCIWVSQLPLDQLICDLAYLLSLSASCLLDLHTKHSKGQTHQDFLRVLDELFARASISAASQQYGCAKYRT